MSFLDKNGKPSGFFVEIFNHIAAIEGWSVEYIYGSWNETYEKIQNGKLDMMGPIAFSEERRKIMSFTSETMLTNWGSIYSATNLTLNSVLDLQGLKIAVLKNDIYYVGTMGLKKVLSKFGVAAKIIEKDSYNEVLGSVHSGEADAGLVNRLYGLQNAQNYNLNKTFIFFNPIEVRFALPLKHNKEIKEAFDKDLAMLKIKTDSAYHKSFNKWFGSQIIPEDSKLLKTILSYAIVVTIIAILVYILMKFKLFKSSQELRVLNKKLMNQIEDNEKTKQYLKQSQERLQYAVEGAEDGIWDLNLVDEIIYISPQYGEILGYDRSKINSHEDLVSLIHPDDKDNYMEEFNKHLSGSSHVFSCEYRMRKADNEWIWMSDRGRIVENKGEKPTRICGINRNISGQKQLEDRLTQYTNELEYKTNALKNLNDNLKDMIYKETEKRKMHEEMLLQQTKIASMGEMVAAIAHQWRQPLSTISLLVQDIKDAYDYEELDENYINDIIRKCLGQIDNMSFTIEDFRKYFQSTTDKIKFDLRPAIVDTVKLMESQYKLSNIVFTFRAKIGEEEIRYVQFNELDFSDSPDMSIMGYPNEFKQVLLNIFDNARDAIKERRLREYNEGIAGFINIVIEMNEDRLIVHISNNGLHIPEEILPNIFDPYFTTKDKNVNKGVGLYMSMIIVEDKMDGKIGVDNTDEGTMFSMDFPHFNKFSLNPADEHRGK